MQLLPYLSYQKQISLPDIGEMKEFLGNNLLVVNLS